jgi:Fe-S-cluster containining protein
MVTRVVGLPVIESCDGCGACCQVVTHPPFYSVFRELGEAAWERLKRERRDLVLEIVADYRRRRAAVEPLSGTPCLWYDADTRRCRHYDYRPLACREFVVGEDDCRDARRRAGIGEP